MMKRKRTLLIVSLLFVVILSSVSLYYKYESNKIITIEFGMFVGSNWDVANANSYDIIDKAIQRFEVEHENVKIHYYSGILKEDYSEWLARKFIMGDAPDVFMVLSEDFNLLTSLGLLKNLKDLYDKDDDFNLSKYYTTALDTGKYQEEQYALPYETVPTLMFVNKTLLEKNNIPMPKNNWTWNDLYQISQSITKDTDQDGIIDQFGTLNYSWLEAAYTNGGVLFDENGKEAYLTDDRIVDSVKYVNRLYDLNKGQQVTVDDYNSGNVAFMPLLFSDYRTYKTYPYKIKKYTKFQWDCMTLPAGENGSNVSEVKTLLMGMNKKTKKEQLAWEFLKLLTYDPEIQIDIFKYSKGVSVLKEVTESDEARAYLRKDTEENEQVIDNQLLSDVIEYGTITPKFQDYNEVIKLADSQVTKIIEESNDIDSSMKILQRLISHYLKQ